MMFQLPAALFFLVSTASSTFAHTSDQSWLLSRDSTQQASTSYTDDDLFKEKILNITNTYRKQHNATSLKWNTSLASTAADWSKRCVFEHSGGPDGENLSSGYANASASIIAWGHERVDYDFKKGQFSEQTGHFTQLVWKSTTTVGCGRTECDGKKNAKRADAAPGWFVVCEYYPPGNVIGAFTQNVQQELPKNEQPDGPSDPEVPESDKKDCPQGGDCSGARRVGGDMAALWVAIFMACAGVWFGL